MFGFHPFAGQSFSNSALTFVDALATTNALTLTQASITPESRVITTTAGELNLTTQTLGANSIVVMIPESSTVLTNLLTLATQTPSLFTYNVVDDNVTEETWSDVVTTTNTESWSDT